MSKLSYSQQHMLRRCTVEWQRIWDVGAANCTNQTLQALESRKLVELRIEPGSEGRLFGLWQVRLPPAAQP